VRDAYGKFAGVVGIISNGILFLAKLIIGLISGSIAIMADAFNNLADASSSIVTLVGFKLSSLPEDREHPYGHARIEYIAGMIVSITVLLMGIELGKGSIEKIINPDPLEFSYISVVVLVLAILIKLWQAAFNVSMGKRINSLTLIATGSDSRNDVLSTSVVLIGVLVEHFFKINIDGYLGLAVAIFIVCSGVSLIKETISPLLGEAPDPELVKNIESMALSYDGVLGIHDLEVHNYGPGKIFASLHVEVDSKVDISISHELVDKIERDIRDKFNIVLTTHMDPVNISDPNRIPVAKIINSLLKEIPGIIEFHDLRTVPGSTRTNIIFDLVVTPQCELTQEEIKELFIKRIKEYNPNFHTIIEFDIGYIEFEEEGD
jgi:cation diffusion facilitator family transporter